MNKLYLIFFFSFFLYSCNKDIVENTIPSGEGNATTIQLVQSAMPIVDSRSASTEEDLAESRIEHVIIYAFEKTSGKLKLKQQQELDHPNTSVRVNLPKESDLYIYAVCNALDTWYWDNVTSYSDLENKVITITGPNEIYKGTFLMVGKIEVKAAQAAANNQTFLLEVERIATKSTFDITFTPEVTTDQFYLTEVKGYNIPGSSYLISRTEDAVYDEAEEVMSKKYIQGYRVGTDEVTIEGVQHTKGELYLFENRRGTATGIVWEDFIDTTMPNWELYKQLFKGEIGKNRFPMASYIIISGVYISDNGKTRENATYRVYLGADNYEDFNVVRNTKYVYTIDIRSCDVVDTRVDATDLGPAQITSDFDTPLDAHCNTVRCFTASRNDWEIYVEDPDKAPWLEISFSARYRPYLAGVPFNEKTMATTRLEGTGGILTYLYIHTDEYVPHIPNEADNTQDESSFRKGVIVLHDKKNNSLARLEVTQRPAQLVVMNIKGREHKYYVEHTLEKKNMQWGFLQYGANPTMTSMINDRWDGRSNTRKLYEEATKVGGMYNPTGLDPATIDVPDDIAVGYAISKNRDRNGNGRIDYDEIMWYLPAVDELAELRRVLQDRNLEFENEDDKFYSSTPYLAGYTAEIPGRAFYVKMRTGETAFAMRNRFYNVICCRRKTDNWAGNADAGINGDLNNDTEWKEEEEIMPSK